MVGMATMYVLHIHVHVYLNKNNDMLPSAMVKGWVQDFLCGYSRNYTGLMVVIDHLTPNIEPVYTYMYLMYFPQHALNLAPPSPTTTRTHTHTLSCVQEKLQALQGTLEPSTVEDLITKQLVRRTHGYGLYVSDMYIVSLICNWYKKISSSEQTDIHTCMFNAVTLAWGSLRLRLRELSISINGFVSPLYLC